MIITVFDTYLDDAEPIAIFAIEDGSDEEMETALNEAMKNYPNAKSIQVIDTRPCTCGNCEENSAEKLDLCAKWTEAEVIVDGALYELSSFIHDDPDEIERFAEWISQMKFEGRCCSGPEELWEIYMYPHFCDRPDQRDDDDDQECVCRQYDLDHKPYWTNEKKAEENA